MVRRLSLEAPLPWLLQIPWGLRTWTHFTLRFLLSCDFLFHVLLLEGASWPCFLFPHPSASSSTVLSISFSCFSWPTYSPISYSIVHFIVKIYAARPSAIQKKSKRFKKQPLALLFQHCLRIYSWVLLNKWSLGWVLYTRDGIKLYWLFPKATVHIVAVWKMNDQKEQKDFFFHLELNASEFTCSLIQCLSIHLAIQQIFTELWPRQAQR